MSKSNLPSDGVPTEHALNHNAIVGAQVRKFRMQAGLTQEVLCDRCGIYRTYLSRIESGKANPTVTVLVALAECLGITVGELFTK